MQIGSLADPYYDRTFFPSDAESEQYLLKRINDMPGLHGKHHMLARQGVCTWNQLGAISIPRWEELLDNLPTKRIKHPEDLQDVERLGPGHINALCELQKQASKEWSHRSNRALRKMMKGKAATENKYVEDGWYLIQIVEDGWELILLPPESEAVSSSGYVGGTD